MAYIAVKSTTATSISVYVAGLDVNYVQGKRLAYWYIDGVEDGSVSLATAIEKGGDYTFHNLEPLTSYLIECEIWYDVDGSGNYDSVELDPIEAKTIDGEEGEYTLEYVNLSEAYGGAIPVSSLPFEWSDYVREPSNVLYCISFYVDTDCEILFHSKSDDEDLDMFGWVTNELDWDPTCGEPNMDAEAEDLEWWDDDSARKYYSNCKTYDFGLVVPIEAGRTYYFWFAPIDNAGDTTIYFRKYTGQSGVGDTIDPWDWYSSNGDASAAATERAFNAITGHGPVSDFSYKVWNDLCHKIGDAQYIALGRRWATDGPGGLAEYATCMDPDDETDRVLTADRFNSMKYNLGRNYSTVCDAYPEGIPVVVSGDPVKGDLFTSITDVLNEWIAILS